MSRADSKFSQQKILLETHFLSDLQKDLQRITSKEEAVLLYRGLFQNLSFRFSPPITALYIKAHIKGELKSE